ncbi:hypothetical protein I3842_03G192200 [Carya illinoinensis]|uniref:Uncharacterized protein n=1 Tax=Carya illinoinensis TaxID=32201 RepID=A0A922JWN4_CARIL|nr:hypothetical protein I3842_03G192200 [Carya illinoinensis]
MSYKNATYMKLGGNDEFLVAKSFIVNTGWWLRGVLPILISWALWRAQCATQMEVEDLNHAVLTYALLQECWQQLMPGLNINASASIFDALLQLCQRMEFDKMATFCSLLWSF